MKKLILILAIAFSSSWAMAQDNNNVPEQVRRNFDSLYPNSQNVSWKMKNNAYEAKMGGDKKLCVRFDKEGNLMETEVETALSALPNSIPMYVIKFYPGLKIERAATITKADGTMSYKAEVGMSDLYFDQKGEFVRVEQRTEMKEEEQEKLGKQ